MLKKQFMYMPCGKRSFLCRGLYQNGYLSIICFVFKESKNSDTFQFWNFPILTLSDSNTFQFWHFPILTLSNSDTFQFWHIPISSKTVKNWILTLFNPLNDYLILVSIMHQKPYQTGQTLLKVVCLNYKHMWLFFPLYQDCTSFSWYNNAFSPPISTHQFVNIYNHIYSCTYSFVRHL